MRMHRSRCKGGRKRVMISVWRALPIKLETWYGYIALLFLEADIVRDDYIVIKVELEWLLCYTQTLTSAPGASGKFTNSEKLPSPREQRDPRPVECPRSRHDHL